MVVAALAVLMGMVALGVTPAAAQTVTYDLKTTSVMRVNLPVSQAVTVIISDAVGKIVSADPLIADAQPITDRSLYLVGKAFGTTTVSLFSEDGAPVGLLAVEVGADVSDIAQSIRAAVPSGNVKVSTVNGRVRLSGTVPDTNTMDRVLAIVAQYGSPQVINTMTLVGGQQVNLEVRILEAQRDAGRQLGIQWGGSIGGVTPGGDPVFNTRNLDATVELRDGQSFAVAGLLQNDTQLNQNQLPWIGDVPVLGSLFKSSSYQKHDTELVVIVTPRLVQPLTPGQVAATPMDQTQPANDFEFFALGQMEVTPKMIKSFQTGAGIVGPYGYIIDLGDTK